MKLADRRAGYARHLGRSPTYMNTGVQKRQMMGYHEIILYWSNEDAAFIAEVPELPGCMAHGDTQEEALASVKEAMHLWLDTAREFGDPIPEPRGRMYA